MEKSCKLCKKYPGCLIHGAAIFGYFIATGRDNEIPADTSDINASSLCGENFELDPAKAAEGEATQPGQDGR
jgi:hypothetical protein